MIELETLQEQKGRGGGRDKILKRSYEQNVS